MLLIFFICQRITPLHLSDVMFLTNIIKFQFITEFGNEFISDKPQIADLPVVMNEYKTKIIKELIAKRIKEIKGTTPYSKIAERCDTTAARISDVANNKIDCQLSTLIDIAIGLRVHPKDLLDILFDFDEYYANLDGKIKQ